MSQKQENEQVLDLEWTLKKYDGRFMDIMDEINNLKAKIRSLSARISRLKSSMEEEVEELEEKEEEYMSVPPLQFSEEWLKNIKPGENLESYLNRMRDR